MKKTLVIAGLAVLSTSAFASKARMEALGQGDVSFYLNDTRSVFLNPAALNDTKNYIVTEWGTGAQGDSATAPRAEGGFFKEMGSFAYGLYLGNNGLGRATAPASTVNTTDKDFAQHQNGLDLMLAGDMGVKWGARIHYANSKDEVGGGAGFEKKNSAFGLGLGVATGDLEGYVNLDLSDKSTGATVANDEWKRKPGFQVGASYKWSGVSFFADYAATKEELTLGTGSTLTSWTVNTIGLPVATTVAAGTNTHKTSNLTLGAARVHEVNPGARIVTDARLVLASDEVTAGKTKATLLPVTFALEADATSWLVARGSVSQNFILGDIKSAAGKKTTVANSAIVNGGATLNFGKLKVDGLVGTTGTAGAAGSKAGVLSTSNLLTRVAVTYNF